MEAWHRDLFEIVWTPASDTAGTLQRLAGHNAEQIEWVAGDCNLTAVFKRLGGQDITVTCTASGAAGQDDVRWQLRVTGTASIVIEAVHFPIFDLRVPLMEHGQVRTLSWWGSPRVVSSMSRP